MIANHNTVMSSNYILTVPLETPEPTDSIGSTVFTHMKMYKDQIAQVDAKSGRIDTFGELLQRCVRTALHMADKRITREHIISSCTSNQMDAAVPYISAQFLGAVMSPVDPALSSQEMTHQLKLIRPRIIFTIPESVPTLERIFQDNSINCEIVVFGQSTKHTEFTEFVKPHKNEEEFVPVHVENLKDTAAIHFTSGSSGLPKGICLSHYDALGQVMHIVRMFNADYYMQSMGEKISSPFTCLRYCTLYWTVSTGSLLTSILKGYCRLICEKFDGKEIWNLIQKYKPAVLVLKPALVIQLLANRRTDVDVQCVASILVVGSPLSKELFLKCQETFPDADISQPYGQTESGFLTMFQPDDALHQQIRKKPEKFESCGLPVRGVTYKVVDPETNKNLGPNQHGELRIKSKFVTIRGYYNEDSIEIFDKDGWLRTGDIVFYDEDYCFFIVGRIKEAFKYQGWFIAPTLLETQLLNHPAVKQAVVIGIPKKEGHHAMGLVVVNDGVHVTEEELEKFVENRVPEMQRLRGGVRFIDSIPMTATGKMKRGELKQMVLDGEL